MRSNSVQPLGGDLDVLPFDSRGAARDSPTANGHDLTMRQTLLDRTDYSRTDEHNQWRLEMNLTPIPPVATP